jgi:RNA polymerase sigma factor (sigma-70 family)
MFPPVLAGNTSHLRDCHSMLQLSILSLPSYSVTELFYVPGSVFEHYSVTAQRMNGFLETSEFKSGLRAACRWAMENYGRAQSSYASAEELEQEVLLRVLKWSPNFRGEASWRTVLRTIAHNAVIDAIRQDKGLPRDHAEVNWDDIPIESLRVFTGAGPQADRLILIRECFAQLSAEERQLFIDCRVKSQSPTDVGARLGVSRQTIAKRLKAISEKLQGCIGR